MKRLRVVWTLAARTDIEGIAAFIAAEAPGRAASFVLKLDRVVARLTSFPRSGGRVPEAPQASPERREIAVEPYRVLYWVKDSAVTVLSVIHGRRLQ